eukprot:353014-Pleurochrysis_carterae.AAC.1
MREVFQKWKSLIQHEHKDEDWEQTHKKEEGSKVKAYGIKHWGRARTIPRINKQVKNFADGNRAMIYQHNKPRKRVPKRCLGLASSGAGSTDAA